MSPGFSSPPNPKAFNALVWEIVRQVPAGKVTTYGRVASLIPMPEGMGPTEYMALSPRWVGGAMAAAPEDVPWQRVVNSEGKISRRPGQGPNIQRQLLEEEGVVFNERGKIPLGSYLWEGPPASWLREHGLSAETKPSGPQQSKMDF
jgi:methylated-DNA-protein-cysteine methyltransferase-like protein